MTNRWISAVINEIDHNEQNWIEPLLKLQDESKTYFYRELRNDALNVFLNLYNDLAIEESSIINSAWMLMELINAINQFVETRNIHGPISSGFNLGNIASISEEAIKISKPKYIRHSKSVRKQLILLMMSILAISF